MNRRDLIQRVVMGTTVLVLSPSILQSCTKEPADNPGITPAGGNPPSGKIELDLTVASNSSLTSTGGSMIVQGIIIVNTGNGNYAAFGSACTHQGTTIGYNASAGKFICPQHGSEFSISGSVVNGPATTALKGYPVSKSGNILTITL